MRIIEREDFLRPTAWSLIAANLVPLLGVLFQGWDATEVAFLYWAETAIIGLIQILRMLTTRQFVNRQLLDLVKESEREELLTTWGDPAPGKQIFHRLFLPAFFVVHFGFFIWIQGQILFSFVLSGFLDPSISGSGGNLLPVIDFFLQRESVRTGLLSIGAAHMFNFLYGVFVHRRHEHDSVLIEFIAPYKRIIIQQFVVILGAPLTLLMGGPAAALVLLIALKTWFDLRALRKQDEYFWLRQQPEPSKIES
ncbi:MAG: hypothetical protein KDC43_11425 [Saprospiraceae bacterium]|nr:hypothetical protein [Saprospiraceae bacterium]MCB0624497.1 hypothetical protein [Saprospiraceae bacterium]MCB0677625.1 hypothetical protein [Saprospiraceae bacterium]MCB0681358.1 hypothetical protein [Saprospiraceae bacterium]